MTAEEIASEIFNEQGFLVVASNYVVEIGASIPSPYTNLRSGDRLFVALRVVGPSTLTEFIEQARRAKALSKGPMMGDLIFPYYYRTEPQD